MKGLKIFLLGIGVIVVGIVSFYITSLFLDSNKAEEASIADQVIQNSPDASTTSRQNGRSADNNLSQSNSAGSVEIKATLLTEKSSRNELVFEIVMNTHSGDLLQYEFSQLASLSFGKEISNAGVFEWQSSNQDSHHLQGLLTWKGEFERNYSSINLNLKDIDNIPSREFYWEKSKVIDEIFE